MLIWLIIIWLMPIGEWADQDSIWVTGRLINVHGQPMQNAEILLTLSSLLNQIIKVFLNVMPLKILVI